MSIASQRAATVAAQRQVSQLLTTQQLIEALKVLDPTGKLPVVVSGHFGEALPIKTSLWFRKQVYLTERGSWRGEARVEFDAIAISVPDLGPEPD